MDLALKNNSSEEEFYDILKYQRIRTVYQPIISLEDGQSLGYEALSRGPKHSDFESPANLFDFAEKKNKLWDLELLCRKIALENARELPKGRLLFINVNPEIINDTRFEKGSTKEYLAQYGISPTNIIFEITEKTAVRDFKSFRKTIDNYISQGYKIAIDDTGAGYSGLRLLTETHPQYIKIDMELIRDIDKDMIKQELIKTFCHFAHITNMKLIAEGIETVDELNRLIDIGVHYGQGYFLQKPVEGFVDLVPSTKQMIIDRNTLKYISKTRHTNEISIGEIARQDKVFTSDANIFSICQALNDKYNLQGLAIVDGGNIPIGIVMKQKLNLHIEKNKNNTFFIQDKIERIMEKNILVLDYETSVKETCRKALSRREDNVYDYIVVTKNQQYYGVVPFGILLYAINERI